MCTLRKTSQRSYLRRAAGLAALLVLTFGAVQAQDLKVPLLDKGIKFAVIGDTGTGSSSQRQVAALLTKYRAAFPFDFVIMLGDNMYGGESERDYRNKFEVPYKPLLDGGVKFYAALGNHDRRTRASRGRSATSITRSTRPARATGPTSICARSSSRCSSSTASTSSLRGTSISTSV